MTTTELVENKLMKRIGVIGQGAQGWVALWKAAGTGQLVAVKGCSVPAGPQADLVKIKVEEEKVVKALMNERGEWPATIAVFHSTIFVKTTNELLQIGEYVHGLSMIQAVRNFTPKAMKAFLHQVCQGLKYIHSRGVIHRDIKAENLMIDADGMVKIIDFGLAVLTTADEAERSLYAGTPGFIAPEIEESRPCTTAADIWSLGICAVELLTGRIPQDSRDMTARELPDSLPWSLREFLFFCFVEDPAYRPSADGLLAHEFLQGPIENEELIKVYIEDQPELEAPVGKPTRMAKFKQGMHKHVLRK
ncbi:Protein kinase [Tulasnella sp. 419]|nr:Protein kinase [Tulasnella sp. 419]